MRSWHGTALCPSMVCCILLSFSPMLISANCQMLPACTSGLRPRRAYVIASSDLLATSCTTAALEASLRFQHVYPATLHTCKHTFSTFFPPLHEYLMHHFRLLANNEISKISSATLARFTQLRYLYVPALACSRSFTEYWANFTL
jgi:hypothetical protein